MPQEIHWTRIVLSIVAFIVGVLAIIFGGWHVEHHCLKPRTTFELNAWLLTVGIVALVSLLLYTCYASNKRPWSLMLFIVPTFVGLVPLAIIGVNLILHEHHDKVECNTTKILAYITVGVQFLGILSFLSWLPDVIAAERAAAKQSGATGGDTQPLLDEEKSEPEYERMNQRRTTASKRTAFAYQ